MKNVLVAGAAGGVGEGIVRELLAGDPAIRVIATGRSEERLALLRSRIEKNDRLTTIAGVAGDEAGARAIATRIRNDVGRLDAAVASIGGWWEGSLLDVDAAEFDRVLDERLTAHFIFARTFLNELLRGGGGTYVGIGGSAAYYPVRNSNLVSIGAAAQLMMTRGFAQELQGRGISIFELVISGTVNTRESGGDADPKLITAGDVGRCVLELIAGGTTAWPAAKVDGPIVTIEPKP